MKVREGKKIRLKKKVKERLGWAYILCQESDGCGEGRKKYGEF